MKIKAVTAVIAAIYISMALDVASGQEVKLHLDWSQQRWDGYPESVGKSTSEWKNHELLVRTIVDWNSSFKISEKNPGVVLHGDKIFLCYRLETPDIDVKSAAPGFVAPVILDFTIRGIPEHDYSIEISNRCL